MGSSAESDGRSKVWEQGTGLPLRSGRDVLSQPSHGGTGKTLHSVSVHKLAAKYPLSLDSQL